MSTPKTALVPVIGPAEEPLGEMRIRVSGAQAGRLVAWAADWPERTWAVEDASELGHLLARQLVAAGEQVPDVPPKLGARVRLLATGNVRSRSSPSRSPGTFCLSARPQRGLRRRAD